MEGVFTEFENENELREYPFSSCQVPKSSDGEEIPTGLFVDACFYPVNPLGPLYLSSVSELGVVSVSDSSGVIMTAAPDLDSRSRALEFYDQSPFSRHVGTMMASSFEALEEFVGRNVERKFMPDDARFASSCVFPVVIDGVVSVDVGGKGPVASSASISNAPDDVIRASTRTLTDGRSTLRFDVIPVPSTTRLRSIKTVICIVDGKTPFRISKWADNTVAVSLYGIDKDSVCSSIHRENSYEMADTCKCRPQPPSVVAIPETHQVEVVHIPSVGDNAFYLVAPNVTGYVNPISITLEDGVAVPDTDGLQTQNDGENVTIPLEEFEYERTSKGAVIQVPGLGGGQQ